MEPLRNEKSSLLPNVDNLPREKVRSIFRRLPIQELIQYEKHPNPSIQFSAAIIKDEKRAAARMALSYEDYDTEILKNHEDLITLLHYGYTDLITQLWENDRIESSIINNEKLSKKVIEERDLEVLNFFLDTDTILKEMDWHVWPTGELCSMYKEEPEGLITFLKRAVMQWPREVSPIIQELGIEDQAGLVEIAKEGARCQGYHLSLTIQDYGIVDKNALLEIAKLAAVSKPFSVAENIQNFMLDEEGLIEIAKLIANVDNTRLNEFLQNFNITKESALIEIAKLSARRNPLETSSDISKYGIKDKAALYEIAKIAVSNGLYVSEYIRNYGIEDKSQLVEIAKLAAQHDGSGTSEFIKKYGISDESILIEIAKIAVQNGPHASEYIQNYRIEDNAALIEIAKLAAQHFGARTSEHIRNYGIKDAAALIEIAKLAAQQDGIGTLDNIKYYDINDIFALNTIREIAIKQAGIRILPKLAKYKITLTQEKYFEIIRNTLVKDPEDSLSDVAFNLKLLKEFTDAKWPQLNLDSFYSEETSIVDQQIKNKWLRWATVFLATPGMTAEDMQWLLTNQIPNILWNIHDPSLRLKLTTHVKALAEQAEYYAKIPASKHTNLSAIALCAMKQEGIPEETLTLIAKSINTDREFRNSKNEKILLNVLLGLIEAKTLSAKDKEYVLKLAFVDPEKTLQRLSVFQAIMIHDSSLLTMENLSKVNDDLGQIVFTLFQKVIPIGNIDDFSAKYLKYLEAFRRPEAILTYAGKLATLNDGADVTLALLGRYLESVFNETFKQERYRTDLSVHLKQVFSDDRLKNEWIKGQQWSLETLLKGNNQEKNQQSLDLKLILQQKILHDKHVDNNLFPHLVDYLKDPANTTTWKRLKAAIKVATTHDEPGLQFQKLCIELLAPNRDDNFRIAQLAKIKKLLETPNGLKGTEEFKHDIGGLLKGMSHPVTTQYKDWVVVDTDDPCDLLLSGTEVESCQRVDGNPDYNKCLLAYLMDGKNRLLAVKNEDGVIVARCYLRLLWAEKKPVVFMERIYPATVSEDIETVLFVAAAERAKRLGIPLVGKKEWNNSKSYKTPIVSLGSSAPYEYVDAGDGVHRGGIFTIHDAYLLSL